MGQIADYMYNIRELVKECCIKETINNPKISVIIPAYNSEEYITKCLLSLLQQTLKEIEIIIVNDGSTDSTNSIISIFEELDSRVKIITQENLGQGIARNNGMELAAGEYIGFVDSDDYIDLDYFEKLYNSAKNNNADISVASVLKHKKYYKKYNVNYKKEEFATNIQDKIKLCADKTYRFFNAWNKLYRAGLIKDNNIKFAQNQIYEDVIFAIKLLDLSNKVISVPNINYHYIEHKFSTVKSQFNKDKKKNDYIKAYTELQQYCKEKNIILPEKLNYYMNNWYNPFVKTYIGQYKAKDMLFGIIPIKTKEINYDFPIDLVYLWVDGNDPEWKKKKKYWQEQYGMNIDKQAIDDSRFIDNDELKYSLRSVEKFAPWINKIYIVTDNQVPKWLNTNNPKIQVVFHQDFIPQENLPLFNSEAIETYLPFIPNLSEHFLYACDDMLFGKHVNKNFFFDENGKAIIRLKQNVSKRHIESSMFTRSILNLQKIILEKYNKKYPYAPHHNIDAYNKSIYLDALNTFKTEFQLTSSHKFRVEKDIQRVIIAYYSLALNYCKYKLYSRVNRWLSIKDKIINTCKRVYATDSIIINANCKNPYEKIRKYNPHLFCINDGEGISNFDRCRMRIFLEELFPKKSSMEI